MSCEPIRAELDAYLDGELEPERAAEVARHLAECGECARALAERRAVARSLRSLPRTPAPADFLEKFRSARPAQLPALPAGERANARRTRGAWRAPWLLGSAAAAAAALLLAVTLHGAHDRATNAVGVPAADGAARQSDQATDRAASMPQHPSEPSRNELTGENIAEGAMDGAILKEVPATTPAVKPAAAPAAMSAAPRGAAAPAAPAAAPEPRAPSPSPASPPPPALADADKGLRRDSGQAGWAGGRLGVAAEAKNDARALEEHNDLENGEAQTSAGSKSKIEARARKDDAGRRCFTLRATSPDAAELRLARIAEGLGGRALPSSLPSQDASSSLGGGAGAPAANERQATADYKKVESSPAGQSASGPEAAREHAESDSHDEALRDAPGDVRSMGRRAPRTVVLELPASRVEAFRKALILWGESEQAKGAAGKSTAAPAEGAVASGAMQADRGPDLLVCTVEPCEKASEYGLTANAAPAAEPTVLVVVTLAPEGQ